MTSSSRGASRGSSPSSSRSASPTPTTTRRSSPPSPTTARSRRSAAGTRPGTSSRSPATAPSAATPRPRTGWRASGWPTTSCGAPTTRSRAAGSSTSACSSTTRRSTSSARSSTASAPRRSCIRGTARSARPRRSSARRTGLRSNVCWRPCFPGSLLRRMAQARTPLSEHLPAPASGSDVDLRDYMPGVEPERQVNDWGRSERVEDLLDKTVVEFLYRYYFRVEVEGVENIPAEGGALLVSNHSGALPPDAPMIAKAIKEEHSRPRPLYLTVEHFFKGYPGFSMLLPKIGGVAAHPANVHRLLYDEGQLVLVFPEGRKGTEKLYKDRYKLRRFGRGGFVEAAMRARAPIVPISAVVAEDGAPVFAQDNLLSNLTGPIYLPITPTFPWFGVGSLALPYLPAKFKIRFLEPIEFSEEGLYRDKSLVQTVAHDIRARIQENIWDMVQKRKSVWFG